MESINEPRLRQTAPFQRPIYPGTCFSYTIMEVLTSIWKSNKCIVFYDMCAKYSCSMHIDLKNTSYFQAIILGEKNAMPEENRNIFRILNIAIVTSETKNRQEFC